MGRKQKLSFSIFVSTVLIIVSVIFLFPIFFCIFTSFKESAEIIRDITFIPHKWSSVNYDYVFARGAKYIRYYLNTIVITVSSVAITLVLSALSGYAFARLPFKGSKLLLAIILFLLAFPLCAILIPI